MITSDDNQLKYENYKDNFKRLKRALAQEFYYEAIFIAYNIMEDRTESILRHNGLWKAYMKNRRRAELYSKVETIQKQVGNGDKLLQKYFSDDLLEKIQNWRNQRNKLIHDLLRQKLEENELRMLAEDGAALAGTLRTRATSCNRAADRANAPKTPRN